MYIIILTLQPESYETYKEEPLEKYCGKLDKDGLDLIEVFF